MEPWLALATRLVPNQVNALIRLNAFMGQHDFTIWELFFNLGRAVVVAHEANDTELLEGIYSYADWCYEMRAAEPEYWSAAWAGFYEHLGDNAATYAAIPKWVKPAIFKTILGELKDRLDNKAKYPSSGPAHFSN